MIVLTPKFSLFGCSLTHEVCPGGCSSFSVSPLPSVCLTADISWSHIDVLYVWSDTSTSSSTATVSRLGTTLPHQVSHTQVDLSYTLRFVSLTDLGKLSQFWVTMTDTPVWSQMRYLSCHTHFDSSVSLTCADSDSLGRDDRCTCKRLLLFIMNR